jgi:hypothetical protein
MGRHARALARRGYAVTGVERDSAAITKARELGGGPTYVEADVQDYQPGTATYDLAIVMSQSFGYFDAATNRDLLRRITSGIRDDGRIILDLWNSEFFATHQGRRDLQTPLGLVQETKRLEGNRFFVTLDYPQGERDNFEWQLFTPSEMRWRNQLSCILRLLAQISRRRQTQRLRIPGSSSSCKSEKIETTGRGGLPRMPSCLLRR